jgi:hypothetical protein
MMQTATITSETLFERISESPRLAATSLIFASILIVVGAVSVYDGYLVLRTGDEIRHFEKNPVGLCLIEYNHGNPNLFLIAKAAGTSVVLASLIVLYGRSQRIAFPIAYALLLFQTGLLIFLERA